MEGREGRRGREREERKALFLPEGIHNLNLEKTGKINYNLRQNKPNYITCQV